MRSVHAKWACEWRAEKRHLRDVPADFSHFPQIIARGALTETAMFEEILRERVRGFVLCSVEAATDELRSKFADTPPVCCAHPRDICA